MSPPLDVGFWGGHLLRSLPSIAAGKRSLPVIFSPAAWMGDEETVPIASLAAGDRHRHRDA
jgi:hypothetical protein